MPTKHHSSFYLKHFNDLVEHLEASKLHPLDKSQSVYMVRLFVLPATKMLSSPTGICRLKSIGVV